MQEFLDQYKTVVLKKYAQFSGRASRKEFWMFVAVNVAISVLLGLTRIQVLATLYSLAILVPSVAVGVRRLRDTGRSVWWILLGLIPLVGQIILIVLLVQKSKSGVTGAGDTPHTPMPSSSPSFDTTQDKPFDNAQDKPSAQI